MSEMENSAVPVRQWLAMPKEATAEAAIERIRRAEDAAYIAVMPDVHAAGDA